MEPMPRTIIYIAGYGRSGSTLVDAFLSSCKNVTGVGECVNFYNEIVKKHLCGCGQQLAVCPFWAPLFARFSDRELHEISVATRATETLFRRPNRVQSRQYKEFWTQFFEHAGSASSPIVDSSKTTRLTFSRPKELSELGFRVVVIYLSRDPYGLVDSLKKGSNRFLSGESGESYSFRFFASSVGGWILGNIGAIIASRRYPSDTVIIDYDDFCAAPEQLIQRLRALRLQIEAPQRIVPGHGLSGNRMRATLSDIRPTANPIMRLNNMEKSVASAMRNVLRLFIWLASRGNK